MNDNDIRTAFGETPEQFRQSVADALDRLEERTVKKRYRISIIAVAALITLIGIAAATGGTRLFEIFGRQPLGDPEKSIVDIASEPIAVNDDITATVDQAYYDGTEFFYEITLTLTDPAACALIDDSAIHKNYAPPADITHIHIAPRLWDRFELSQEMGEEYHNGGGAEEAQLEDMGNGVYKLYGRSFVYFSEPVALPDELDVDVNLHLTYAPRHADFHQEQEPIDAEIPFHITKTAAARKYALTPVNVPDDWNITLATLEMSDISGAIRIEYDLGGPIIEDPVFGFDENDPESEAAFIEQSMLESSYMYDFHLRDPKTPGEHMAKGAASISFFEYFSLDMQTPAMETVPDRLTFDVTSYEEYEDGTCEEVPVATIEFAVSPAE